MRIARLRHHLGSLYRIEIVEVPKHLLAKVDGVWKVENPKGKHPPQTKIVLEVCVQGFREASSRLDGIATHHNAIPLYNIAAMDAAMDLPEEEVPPEPTPPPKRRKTEPKQKAPEVYAYRVTVTHREWPLGIMDRERLYVLGETPDELAANRIADKWRQAGYTVWVFKIRKRRRGGPEIKITHTLWEGDVHRPIVCLAANRDDAGKLVPCEWVGGNLGSHVHSHGLTMDAYRSVYGYDGPVTVGKAAQALAEGPRRIRERNDIRLGMYVAVLTGEYAGLTLKLSRKTREGEYHLRTLDDEQEFVLTQEEFFSVTRPISAWTKDLRRRMGEVVDG